MKKTYYRRKLINFLKEARAGQRCEICGGSKVETGRNLTGAHIDNLGNAGPDTAENIIIACWGKCHRHDAFYKGLIITPQEALNITRRRNKYFNIPNNLKGEDLPLKTKPKFLLDPQSKSRGVYARWVVWYRLAVDFDYSTSE